MVAVLGLSSLALGRCTGVPVVLARLAVLCGGRASGLHLDSGGARVRLGLRARARLALLPPARLVHGSAWVALAPCA